MDIIKKYAWILLLFVTFAAVLTSVMFFNINVTQGKQIRKLQQEKLDFDKDVEAYEAKLNSLPTDAFFMQLDSVFANGYEEEIDEFTGAIIQYFSEQLAEWLERNNIKLYYETNKESYDSNTG